MELLPVNDQDWDEGRIGLSEALYTTSLSSVTNLGSFARACQAAHMLGKVIRHIAARNESGHNADLTTEAFCLHSALTALHQAVVEETNARQSVASHDTKGVIALSMCCSARFRLYHQYSCNELFRTAVSEPSARDTEFHQVALTSIPGLILSTMPCILRAEPKSPLTAQSLYYAATQCAWYVREDQGSEYHRALESLLEGLRAIAMKWEVGGMSRRPPPQSWLLCLTSSQQGF